MNLTRSILHCAAGLVVLFAAVGCVEQTRDVELRRVDLSADALGENLRRHVEVLARAPRTQGSQQLAAAREYCAEQLSALGYTVTRHDFGLGDCAGQNVVGTLRGTELPDEQVLLSAHIDSVDSCNGADDNASGVAGLLEAARALAHAPHPRSLLVACWDQEERGLVGSLKHATAAHLLGHDIRMSFVFEMIGYRSALPGSQRLPVAADQEFLFELLFPAQYQKYVDSERRGDFIALVTDAAGTLNATGGERYQAVFSQAAEQLRLPVQALPLSALLMLALPDLSRSDHSPFWLNGYSAMMITDTANLRNPHYHCADGADDVASLDFAFAAQVTQAATQAVTFALDE
jgi:Zn-dependent M28 family amino/carboxypeptidase